VTLSVPSAGRVLAAVVAVAVALALVLVGIRIGTVLLRTSPVMSVAAESDLSQIQLVGGVVYVGQIINDDDGAIRLRGGAQVRQEAVPAASGQQASTQIVVQSLATDPYGLTADVVIPMDQVTLVGAVSPGSSLAQAYAQAMSGSPTATPEPSP